MLAGAALRATPARLSFNFNQALSFRTEGFFFAANKPTWLLIHRTSSEFSDSLMMAATRCASHSCLSPRVRHFRSIQTIRVAAELPNALF
jgi:hypothetical protein